jgi:ferredoxin-NADP reductase
MEYIVKILMIQKVTHDVFRIVTDKPRLYEFIPGQSTFVSINEKDSDLRKIPLTMTSLADDLVLEFIVKVYPVEFNQTHKGITPLFLKLKPGDEIIIEDAWGDLEYKGPGIFIAGGTGITPFLAILRELDASGEIDGNILVFANKRSEDIIFENELRAIFQDQGKVVFVLTEELREGYFSSLIDYNFLKSLGVDLTQYFYLSGPPEMARDLKRELINNGVDKVYVLVENKVRKDVNSTL